MSRKTFAEPDAPVEAYLATLSDQRATEARALIALMSEVTGEPAVMGGSSIIGFGSDGEDGTWPTLAFAPRKAKISLYITGDVEPYREDLAALGKHSTGKGCIYLNKLSDADPERLAALVQRAFAEQTPC